jgi:long-subunit acyl-CoA synthetase (AMP-forming)
VLALYESIVAGVNKDLAQFEKIKKLILVPDEFSMANGALTSTVRVRANPSTQSAVSVLKLRDE